MGPRHFKGRDPQLIVRKNKQSLNKLKQINICVFSVKHLRKKKSFLSQNLSSDLKIS